MTQETSDCTKALTFCKAERLCSKKEIEELFSGGNARSFSIFPLRIVYKPVARNEVPVSLLISVSKRHFKRAVKRNHVKRQVREAWRKQKYPLCIRLQEKGEAYNIAFIYLSDDILPSDSIDSCMNKLIQHLIDKAK